MRGRAAIIAVALLLAGVGYTLIWQRQMTRLESAVRVWVETANQAPDTRVTLGRLTRSGFPFRTVLSAEDTRLTYHSDAGRVSLRLDHVDAVSHLWTPGHWVLSAEGLNAAGGFHATGPLRLSAQRVQASRTDGAAGGWRVAVAAANARLSGPMDRASLALSQARLFIDRPGPADREENGVREPLVLRLAARADTARIAPPPDNETPLGPRLTALDLRLGLRGAPPDFGHAGLAQWRDAGGTVEVDTLSLAWGDSDLALDGSLALDEEFRPFGAFSGTARRAAALLRQLAAVGVIDATVPAQIRPVLPPDAKGPVSISLGLQDGSLTLQGRDLAPLPALVEGASGQTG